MQKILDDLTKLNNQCSEHSMRAIDVHGFEKYFATIDGELNHLYKKMHSSEESMPIIKVAYQLLDKACRHHLNENIVSTQYAVELFNHAVQLLLKIISADFGVDKEAYDKAYKTSMLVRAFQACGMKLPGSSSQTYERWKPRVDVDALPYAAANIEEFAIFVYDTGRNGTHEVDPFKGPQSEILTLYTQVNSLMAAGIDMATA